MAHWAKKWDVKKPPFSEMNTNMTYRRFSSTRRSVIATNLNMQSNILKQKGWRDRTYSRFCPDMGDLDGVTDAFGISTFCFLEFAVTSSDAALRLSPKR
jgi:hypothetical protein